MANPRDLAEQGFALLQDALRDSEPRASELDEQLERTRAPRNTLEEQLDVLTHRLDKIDGERAYWERQAGHLEDVAEAERVKVAQLKKKLLIAESGPDELTTKEVHYWRTRAAAFDTERHAYKTRLANLLRELMERNAQIAKLASAMPQADAVPIEGAAGEDAITCELRRQVQQRDEWIAELHMELDALRTQGTGSAEPPLETQAQIETLRMQVLSLERALSAAGERAEAALVERTRQQKEAANATEALERRFAQREQDLTERAQQIRELEGELKEEKEHAENLGQLANERREQMTKLKEQLEEAEERYAEADWRLGRSLYFEKLVKRRKGLILKLLEALRAKMKANVALKAGLDGLRTYKASAALTHQKLLQCADKMKADLAEAEDTIKKHRGATHTKEEFARVESRARDFESRINTQAEIIQSLESELRAARLAHRESDDETATQLEQVRAELETKKQIIANLQREVDEQQRKLGKLRGSKSETLRLEALRDKDRSEIDELQRELAQVREALSRQSATAASGSENPGFAAMLKERDQRIARLMGAIRELEAKHSKANKSAEG